MRRDNIGELVCTTPLFGATKAQHANVENHALVDSFDSAVRTANPNFSAVRAYEKLKNESSLFRRPTANARRKCLLIAIRQSQLCYPVVADTRSRPRVIDYRRWIRPIHSSDMSPKIIRLHKLSIKACARAQLLCWESRARSLIDAIHSKIILVQNRI